MGKPLALMPHCPFRISRCVVTNIFAALGLYSLSKATLSTWRWLYLHGIARTNLSSYGANQGAYALITGASDGIGKALAMEGAAKGFNLVLIARTQSKLEAVRDEINHLYPGVKIMILALDCGDEAQDETINKIVEAVKGLDLSIVWNNVGVTTSGPKSLANVGNEEIRRILRVNNAFTMTLTARLIPKLKEHRGKSIIVNISSFLSLLPACNYTPYSSSKAFLNQFSESLNCELEGSNVSVMLYRPAHVVTPLSGITKASLMVPSAQTWAQAAWQKLGVTTSMSPYLPHALQELFALLTPNWIIRSELRKALRDS